jgi:NADH:ubiquinone oxidoreductase subunit K
MLVNQFLFLGAILFCIGVYGVLARRNAVLVLMSIELILNSVNINLVAFGAMWHVTDPSNLSGQVFALFVIAIAAAEVGVGGARGEAVVGEVVVGEIGASVAVEAVGAEASDAGVVFGEEEFEAAAFFLGELSFAAECAVELGVP